MEGDQRRLGHADELCDLDSLREVWAHARIVRQRSFLESQALDPEHRRADTTPTFEVVPLSADIFAVRPPAVLDAFTGPELSELLSDLVELGARRVILDLSGATLIDSSGLGAIFSGHLQLRADGGTLELVPAGPAVMRGFELTGLDRVFAGLERRVS